MLVLERKISQRIVIILPNSLGEIIIEVAATRGDRAKLAFTAPRYCKILREEIHTLNQAQGVTNG